MIESAISKVKPKTLQILTQNVKRGMMQVIDMPDRSKAKKQGAIPASQFFTLQHAALTALEAEITRRGMNPKHPAFGPDLSSEIQRIANA